MKICMTILLMAATIAPAHAAFVSTDWNASGDGLITRDTTTSLDWLDLTATAGLSYNFVASQFGVGGAYESWRYASDTEATSLLTEFGFPEIDGYRLTVTSSPGAELGPKLSTFQSYFGYNYLLLEGSFLYPILDSFGLTSRSNSEGTHEYFGVNWIHNAIGIHAIPADCCNIDDANGTHTASFLVRSAPVPLPAAAWLLLSGIGGIVAVARRRKATTQAIAV